MSVGKQAEPSCLNCGHVVTGRFCGRCGQSVENPLRSLLSLVSDLMDEWFGLDNRVLRTIQGLFGPPGKTAAEYLGGKRARYVPPVRLYLVVSALFFLTLQIVGTGVETGKHENPAVVVSESGDNKPLESATSQANRPETSTSDTPESKVKGDSDDDPQIQIGLLSWLPDAWADTARTRLKSGARKLVRLSKQNPEAALQLLLQQMPVFLFLMMPFFALWLKVLYIGSGKMYLEHLTVALYSHSAVFVLLWMGEMAKVTASFLGSSSIAVVSSTVIWFAIPVGLLLTQRRVYGQGWWWTVLKFNLAGLGHLLLLMLFLSLSLIASLLRF